MINVTWTPPVVPNGIIHQYIVQRVNSSGKFYYHIPANQYTISLPYFNDALVFVATVNLYGQSVFVQAKSQGIIIFNSINVGLNQVYTDRNMPSISLHQQWYLYYKEWSILLCLLDFLQWSVL